MQNFNSESFHDLFPLGNTMYDQISNKVIQQKQKTAIGLQFFCYLRYQLCSDLDNSETNISSIEFNDS